MRNARERYEHETRLILIGAMAASGIFWGGVMYFGFKLWG